MTYDKVNARVLAGEAVSTADLNDAIIHQLAAVTAAVAAFAKHRGVLAAADYHPFPVPDDQEGRVCRRADAINREMDRLCKLYCWKAIASFTTV